MSLVTPVIIDGNIAILQLDGRLTLGEPSNELRNAVLGQIANGRTRIGLVTENVPYIDSSGWGILVFAFTAASKAGGQLVLIRPNRSIVKTGTMNNLIQIYKRFDSVDAAVAYLKQEKLETLGRKQGSTP